ERHCRSSGADARHLRRRRWRRGCRVQKRRHGHLHGGPGRHPASCRGTPHQFHRHHGDEPYLGSMSESRALYYPAGESIVEEVVVKKANGDVVNLTGATSSFKVYKQQSGAAIFEKTVGDGVTLDSPTNGEASVETDPADTA